MSVELPITVRLPELEALRALVGSALGQPLIIQAPFLERELGLLRDTLTQIGAQLMADWAGYSEALQAIGTAIDGLANRVGEDTADQARVDAAVEELHELAARINTMAQEQPTPAPEEPPPA